MTLSRGLPVAVLFTAACVAAAVIFSYAPDKPLAAAGLEWAEEVGAGVLFPACGSSSSCSSFSWYQVPSGFSPGGSCGSGGTSSCTLVDQGDNYIYYCTCVCPPPPPPSPSCALSVSPATVYVGQTSTLSWSSSNASSGSVNQGVGSVSPVSGGSRTLAAATQAGTKTFTGTFSGNGGTTTCQATITALPQPAPTATLVANPSTIDSGQSTALFWSSTNATSCTAAGGFSTGGATANPPGGVSTGVLTQTSNYQITCTGPSGTSAPALATVTVLQPSVSISATPDRVVSGGSVTVSWDAQNVNSCTVTRNGTTWQTLTADDSRAINSSATDAVTSQTTYVISCTNNASATAATATQVVNIQAGFQEF